MRKVQVPNKSPDYAYAYADLDGFPVRISRDKAEAWIYRQGAWREINYAETSWNAIALTRAAFERRFGSLLPPLSLDPA